MKSRFPLWIWLTLFSASIFVGRWARGQSAEEWAELKREYGLPANLNYNDWVAEGCPRGGPSPAELAAERAAAARAAAAHAINNQALDAYNNGDYASAEDYFKQCLTYWPNDPVILQSITYCESQKANDQGVAYSQTNDWGDAAAWYQKALELNPSNKIMQQNLAQAQARLANDQGNAYCEKGDWIDAARCYQEAVEKNPFPENADGYQQRFEMAEKKVANIRATEGIGNSIQNLAQSLSASSAGDEKTAAAAQTGGLDFISSDSGLKDAVSDDTDGHKTEMGSMGYRVAKPNLTPATPGVPGTDTKAGDQLLSAAATAKVNGDLTVNYDQGGAKGAGSLPVPTDSVDPATFPSAVRNDPRMITALKNLDDLKTKGAALDAQLQQLVAERNQAKDPQKSADLSRQVDQKNNEKQANFAAIVQGEDTVKKVHRSILFKEDSAPGPPPAKAASVVAGAAKGP